MRRELIPLADLLARVAYRRLQERANMQGNDSTASEEPRRPTAMKRRDAEREVTRVYQYEYLKEPDSMIASEASGGALHFYGWLSTNRPDLLDFPCSGDRYQVIAGWVETLRIPPRR